MYFWTKKQHKSTFYHTTKMRNVHATTKYLKWFSRQSSKNPRITSTFESPTPYQGQKKSHKWYQNPKNGYKIDTQIPKCTKKKQLKIPNFQHFVCFGLSFAFPCQPWFFPISVCGFQDLVQKGCLFSKSRKNTHDVWHDALPNNSNSRNKPCTDRNAHLLSRKLWLVNFIP